MQTPPPNWKAIRQMGFGSAALKNLMINDMFITPGLHRPGSALSMPASPIERRQASRRVMVGQAEVESFIGSSLRSVWALELLKLLLADDSGHKQADLVLAMRSSDAVVAQSLAALVAVGLVLVDSDGTVRVNRSDPRTSELLDATMELYRTSPDRVRRLIVSSSLPGVTAFADAFRLRKD
jgi:hypothetical protein